MKIFKKISLGALLVKSVLGVLSHFEKNSAFSKVSVFCSIFDVQKILIPPERAQNYLSMKAAAKNVE